MFCTLTLDKIGGHGLRWNQGFRRPKHTRRVRRQLRRRFHAVYMALPVLRAGSFFMGWPGGGRKACQLPSVLVCEPSGPARPFAGAVPDTQANTRR